MAHAGARCGMAGLLLALLLPAVSFGQTYSTDAAPIAIPDNTPGGTTMAITVPETFPVSSLVVTVGVTHTWINDLRQLILTSPSGQTIALWPASGIGGSGDNLKHTTLDASAMPIIGTPGSTTAPFRNRYQPVGAFPPGLTSAGTWTLKAADGADADLGTLDYFILSFNEKVRIGNAGATTNQSGSSSTRSPSQTGLNIAIPDGNPLAGAVSTATVDAADAQQITGIDVSLATTHGSLSDLRVRLTHPSGAPTVGLIIPGDMTGSSASPVTDAAGTPNRPYTTTLAIGAPALSTGTAPYRGRFAPSGDLTAFNGLSSAGNWTLHVTDEAGNGVAGTLREWSIHIRGIPYVPTGNGWANPSGVFPGTTPELRVHVTPAAGSSLDNITSVIADVSELTGASPGTDLRTLAHITGTPEWKASVWCPDTSIFGVKSIPFTINDSGSPNGPGSGVFTVLVARTEDECQTTTLIATIGFSTLTGSTSSATTSFIPVSNTCGPATNAGGGRDIFARFIPPATATYMIDLCGSGFDTNLAVFDACPATDAAQIGCNDDSTYTLPCISASSTQSRLLAVPLIAGQTCYIRIGGWNETTGNYVLNIQYTDPAGTGACCTGPSCTLTDLGSCTGAFTAGAACEPGTCGTPANELCCRGVTCAEVPAGTCTGTSTGGGAQVVSACGPGNSLATCCFADFNHDQAASIDDLFLFLNAYFLGSPYANFGGDGAAAPTIDDLFLYINAYFTGCAP